MGDVEVTFDTEGPKLMAKPKVREVQRLHQPGMWCRLVSESYPLPDHVYYSRPSLSTDDQ